MGQEACFEKTPTRRQINLHFDAPLAALDQVTEDVNLTATRPTTPPPKADRQATAESTRKQTSKVK